MALALIPLAKESTLRALTAALVRFRLPTTTLLFTALPLALASTPTLTERVVSKSRGRPAGRPFFLNCVASAPCRKLKFAIWRCRVKLTQSITTALVDADHASPAVSWPPRLINRDIWTPLLLPLAVATGPFGGVLADCALTISLVLPRRENGGGIRFRQEITGETEIA